MTVMDDKPRSHVATNELAEELVKSGALDDLFAQIDSGEVQLTGDGGMVPALIKAALERGLQAELTDHLGYEKGDRSADGSGNARNGTTGKTVKTEVGDVELAIPRDRAGTFTPMLVPKGTRRLGGLDEMIISLYAGGIDESAISNTIWLPRWERTCPTRQSAISSTRSPMRSSPGKPGPWSLSTRRVYL